jgi:hypothetical protein
MKFALKIAVDRNLSFCRLLAEAGAIDQLHQFLQSARAR